MRKPQPTAAEVVAVVAVAAAVEVPAPAVVAADSRRQLPVPPQPLGQVAHRPALDLRLVLDPRPLLVLRPARRALVLRLGPVLQPARPVLVPVPVMSRGAPVPRLAS